MYVCSDSSHSSFAMPQTVEEGAYHLLASNKGSSAEAC